MWYKESVFYQIYPFGFCGAPYWNDGILESRIVRIKEWIPHMKKIGVNAVYLCPIFESDVHGYDTRDYRKLDCRLGSNEDFAEVCKALHEEDIRVVVDGVFNHVGRGFWAFRDVQEKKQDSAYKDWFCLDFSRNSNDNDGFWYEGWEGHFNLVKLNLHNPQVVEHIFESIRYWVDTCDIDGLRLDVAYSLDHNFLRKLKEFCKSLKSDFYLVGETIHGDYNQIVNDQMLDSCTNYEIYKGIFSSINDSNMFEVAHSLNRQFGPDHWTIYKGLSLFNFVDNHDVSRLSSILKKEENIKNAYALLFTIPGVPCIYYGSEWGEKGEKTQGGDESLRPYFEEAVENELTEWIAALSNLRKKCPALNLGNYQQLYLTNQQFVFQREYKEEKIAVAINIDAKPHTANFPINGTITDLMRHEPLNVDGSLEMAEFSAYFYKIS